MKLGQTLEARLNLSIGFIMLVMTGLGSGWAVRDARESVRREAMASVELAIGLMDAAFLAGDSRPSFLHEWAGRVGRLDRIRHLKIDIVSGGALPVSEGPARQDAPIDDVPAWFRWLVISEPIVMDRRIRLGAEQPVLVHVESWAEDEIREAWEETRAFLFLLGLILLAIYLSVNRVAGRALRPVASILRGLNAIEKGDYDARLPHCGLPELDRISAGINHLSASLKTSRDEIRALTRHSLSIQEGERRSIAQEIHDEFGQNLTAIKMMSGAIMANPASGATAAGEIQMLCDRLFGVVRSLIRRLRPMMLEDLGLLAALQDLANHWRTTAPGLDVDIRCDSALEEIKGEIALEVYRIIQEALTNTIRHSGATCATVLIEAGPSRAICLTIRDNGQGMQHEPLRRGFGLLGMRERVASLQGGFRLASQPGEGLEILITLPMPDEPHE